MLLDADPAKITIEQFVQLYKNRQLIGHGHEDEVAKRGCTVNYWRRLTFSESRHLLSLEEGGCAWRLTSDCEHGMAMLIYAPRWRRKISAHNIVET